MGDLALADDQPVFLVLYVDRDILGGFAQQLIWPALERVADFDQYRDRRSIESFI